MNRKYILFQLKFTMILIATYTNNIALFTSKITVQRREAFKGLRDCPSPDSIIKATKRQSVILRWLRLSELLNEYSKQSMINVVTLPVPTSHIKPREYTAILNLLSDQNQLPPTIIMRGNGEQTLTFYSE